MNCHECAGCSGVQIWVVKPKVYFNFDVLDTRKRHHQVHLHGALYYDNKRFRSPIRMEMCHTNTSIGIKMVFKCLLKMKTKNWKVLRMTCNDSKWHSVDDAQNKLLLFMSIRKPGYCIVFVPLKAILNSHRNVHQCGCLLLLQSLLVCYCFCSVSSISFPTVEQNKMQRNVSSSTS